MSNGIFARPECIGKAFTDNPPPRFPNWIMLVEGTSFENWYAHGAEILSAHNAPSGPGKVAAAVAVGTLGCHNTHARVPAHNGPRHHCRSGLHSGDCAHAFKKSIDQLARAFFVGGWYVHSHQKAVL